MTSLQRRSLRFTVAACTLVALSDRALAQSAPDPDATPQGQDAATKVAEAESRRLFDEAYKLAEAGDWPAACRLLKGAHELNASGGTAMQLAGCYEKTNEPAKAVPLYEWVVANRDRTTPARVKQAEERLAALRAASEALAPKKPDPATQPAAPSPSPSPSRAPDRAASSPDATSPAPVAAYVALGVGGAGVVVGGIFGALVLAQASSVRDACPDLGGACLVERQRDVDAAHTKAWVSNVGFVVGAAGLVTGAVLLFTRKKPEPPPAGLVASARGLGWRF